jgi:SAM-dependent methyltransferase
MTRRRNDLRFFAPLRMTSNGESEETKCDSKRATHTTSLSVLPAGRCRILEVGCGAAELPTRLSKDGHAILAVDTDPESVAAARTLGVDARVATWPDFDEGYFDAVLFTRSLHQIHPLGESIRAQPTA